MHGQCLSDDPAASRQAALGVHPLAITLTPMLIDPFGIHSPLRHSPACCFSAPKALSPCHHSFVIHPACIYSAPMVHPWHHPHHGDHSFPHCWALDVKGPRAIPSQHTFPMRHPAHALPESLLNSPINPNNVIITTFLRGPLLPFIPGSSGCPHSKHPSCPKCFTIINNVPFQSHLGSFPKPLIFITSWHRQRGLAAAPQPASQEQENSTEGGGGAGRAPAAAGGAAGGTA